METGVKDLNRLAQFRPLRIQQKVVRLVLLPRRTDVDFAPELRLRQLAPFPADEAARVERPLPLPIADVVCRESRGVAHFVEDEVDDLDGKGIEHGGGGL